MRISGLAASLGPWLRPAVCVVFFVALTACGGGGGGGGSGGSTPAPSGPTAQPIAATAANTVPIAVGPGVGSRVNIPTASVTVCATGTSNCQTVDNVLVDTASFGLRLLASALPQTFLGTLPTTTVTGGALLAECGGFADGFTWGTVRTVDVKLGGETATAVPIQLLGDLAASTVPQACSNVGPSLNTQAELGENGILGVGVAVADCGAGCAQSATGSAYYACPGGTNCASTTVAVAQQVANPVASFAGDNNGVIVQLPPVAATGAPSAAGTLVFGVGTQSNNPMSAAQRFPTDPFGNLSTTFNGVSLAAFVDSGSNGLYFADSGLPQCTGQLAGFYCPSSEEALGATLIGADGTSGNVSFNVANAATLFANTANFVFNDLAGQFGSASSLDLGLPFFYGRYVYYGIDRRASGGAAPFVAF